MATCAKDITVVSDAAVFRRDWSEPVPRIARAMGVLLEEAGGRCYLDAVSGIFVTNIGYGVDSVGQAMARQASEIPFVYAGDFATDAETQLAARLVAMAPPGFAKAYFVSGGSEANEVAFKMARKYQRARDRDGRWRIASRWQSYHGATIATLSASGKVSRRADFLPYMLDFPKLPAVNLYRRAESQSPEEFGADAVAEVERRIAQEDPASIAAIIVEPVTGAGSGALVPPPGYMRGLRALCDRYDILLIADEVVSGCCRTGPMFASAGMDGLPDIITFGKGVAAGYAPLAGVLLSEKVVAGIEGGQTSSLFTGYTYSGHAVSCAAGLAVLDVMQRENYAAVVESNTSWFFETARDLLDHSVVGDIRGAGLLMGIEFVADRETRAPFPPSCRFYQRVIARARERDLLIRGENGCIDGVNGDHVMLAPAFCATREQLFTMLSLLRSAINDAVASL